jgi:beta-galactosidase/beta-glucuronidase
MAEGSARAPLGAFTLLALCTYAKGESGTTLRGPRESCKRPSLRRGQATWRHRSSAPRPRARVRRRSAFPPRHARGVFGTGAAGRADVVTICDSRAKMPHTEGPQGAPRARRRLALAAPSPRNLGSLAASCAGSPRGVHAVCGAWRICCTGRRGRMGRAAAFYARTEDKHD